MTANKESEAQSKTNYNVNAIAYKEMIDAFAHAHKEHAKKNQKITLLKNHKLPHMKYSS